MVFERTFVGSSLLQMFQKINALKNKQNHYKLKKYPQQPFFSKTVTARLPVTLNNETLCNFLKRPYLIQDIFQKGTPWLLPLCEACKDKIITNQKVLTVDEGLLFLQIDKEKDLSKYSEKQ